MEPQETRSIFTALAGSGLFVAGGLRGAPQHAPPLAGGFAHAHLTHSVYVSSASLVIPRDGMAGQVSEQFV